MKYLHQVFGLSKQGYYQRMKRWNKQEDRNATLLAMVCGIRKKHPRCGTRKLMVYLREELLQTGIKIGRDALNCKSLSIELTRIKIDCKNTGKDIDKTVSQILFLYPQCKS